MPRARRRCGGTAALAARGERGSQRAVRRAAEHGPASSARRAWASEGLQLREVRVRPLDVLVALARQASEDRNGKPHEARSVTTRQRWPSEASEDRNGVSVGPAGAAGMQRWPPAVGEAHNRLTVGDFAYLLKVALAVYGHVRGPADRLPRSQSVGPAGFAITTTGSPNQPLSPLDDHKRGSIYAP
jgi:hypothetical protein